MRVERAIYALYVRLRFRIRAQRHRYNTIMRVRAFTMQRVCVLRLRAYAYARILPASFYIACVTRRNRYAARKRVEIASRRRRAVMLQRYRSD